MERSSFKITTWKDEKPAFPRQVRHSRLVMSPTMIAVWGALLLHVLAIRSLQHWTGDSALKQTKRESTYVRHESTSNMASSLLFVTVPPNPLYSDRIQNMASITAQIILTRTIHPPAVEPSPPILDNASLELREDVSQLSDGNLVSDPVKARYLKIYNSQMYARIARAWRRPRTPPVEDNSATANGALPSSFICEAQIIQDSSGNVQEILLPTCNGTDDWKNSLVQAIRESSPLPAPPDSGVFSRSVTLSFVGLAYSPTDPQEDYELAPSPLARSTP